MKNCKLMLGAGMIMILAEAAWPGDNPNGGNPQAFGSGTMTTDGDDGTESVPTEYMGTGLDGLPFRVDGSVTASGNVTTWMGHGAVTWVDDVPNYVYACQGAGPMHRIDFEFTESIPACDPKKGTWKMTDVPLPPLDATVSPVVVHTGSWHAN